MPIPVPSRTVVVPELARIPHPPFRVPWGKTSVSVLGSNGEGEEIPLTGFSTPDWPGIILQPGATGLDMPPYALFSDDSPNLDGSIYRNARAAAREVMLPVYLNGPDRRNVNLLKRKLFQSLNPKRGYCVLKFTEGDGTTRLLKAYYKGGMEGSESTDTAGFTWVKYGLTFTAMDPWFYPEREVVTRWGFGTGSAFLSSSAAFLPLKISQGVMGAGQGIIIDNPGDVEAWPVWTLKGPIRSFSLGGPDGELVKASPPSDGSDLVAANRVLTIDTRPGYKTVMDDLGTNYWPVLDTNPEFWSVEPGETEVNVVVVAGVGKASVTLSFYPRYASYV
jgi:hypothetical protein